MIDKTKVKQFLAIKFGCALADNARLVELGWPPGSDVRIIGHVPDGTYEVPEVGTVAIKNGCVVE